MRSICMLLAGSCALLAAGIRPASAQTLYFPPVGGGTWETVSPASLGWNNAYIDSLRDYLGANNTRAFIVLQEGRIAIEQYFGTFTKDSAWYWASAGKTLTSVLVGIAQQEGHLTILDTTSKWLGKGWTSSPPANEDRITIRHQLTMTSGLDDGVADPYCTDRSCLVYLADPGLRWAYHNGPYTLLDSVVRSATGLGLNQYFLTRVAAKTGMTGTFLKSGYNNVFFSTGRSMARFGLMILNHGTWGTTPVLTDTAYFRAMVNTSQQLNLSYGYLWWLNGKTSFMLPQTQLVFPGSMNPSAPNDMIAALGKNGQFINVVPSLNLVFIRMGDAPDNSLVPFTMNEEIWKRLTRVFPATAVEASHDDGPKGFALHQNYPNPFNPSTTIEYDIPEGAQVSVVISNSLGQEVARLIEGYQNAGRYRLTWVVQGLASGIYICRMKANNFVTAIRLGLIR